jgi:hypothetical protein
MQSIRIRAAALAAACLCSLAAPLAQQPVFQQPPAPSQPAGPATGMIGGRIVDAANGRPISGAMVGLLGGAPVGRGGAPRQLLTDSDGRFVFAGLAQGRYGILLQRSGYFATPITMNRPIDLGADQKLMDLTVRLRRLASAAGMVTDENGDPITGMTVVAYRRSVVNGQVMAIPSSESRTDDRGAYRLANLQPGDYIVCACRMDPIPIDGVLLTTLAADPSQLLGLASRALKVGADAASIDGARTFAPTFYPASTLQSRATHLALADGENKTGVDIQTASVRSSRLSGRVIGAPGAVNASSIRLRFASEMPEATTAIEPALVQPDGRFDFAGVPPGSYVLSAWMLARLPMPAGPSGTLVALAGGRAMAAPPVPPPPPGSSVNDDAIVSGQVTVSVGDADVTGISIVLRPAAKVQIKWDLPPGLPTPPPNQPFIRSVQLVPLPFEARSVRPFGRQNPDGTSTLGAVLPGRYGLALAASPNLRLEKVMLRGEDLTDLPIEVGEADIPEVIVTMTSGAGAKISGTVPANSGDNCVLLFPADRKLWVEPAAARRWYATLPVSRAGTFASDASLPAGEYLVVLVPDEQASDWQIRSELEKLAPRATRVSVAAGEIKVIEVKR